MAKTQTVDNAFNVMKVKAKISASEGHCRLVFRCVRFWSIDLRLLSIELVECNEIGASDKGRTMCTRIVEEEKKKEKTRLVGWQKGNVYQ